MAPKARVIHGGKDNLSATSAPGVTDDASAGYGIRSFWVNLTTDNAYICVDATTGAAVWHDVTFGDGDVTAAANLTDNAVVRGDGGAKGVQTSGIIIDDSDNVDFGGGALSNGIASALTLARIAGSTFFTVQHLQDVFHSSGWVSGGTVTDAGGETVDVAAGIGLIRATDSRTAEILFFDWPASLAVAIPTDTTRWIGIEYNAGSPQVVIKTSHAGFNFNTDFPVAKVVNEAGTFHLQAAQQAVGDHAAQMILRMHGTMPLQRDERLGGLILGETGTRNITFSAGALWDDLNYFPIAAIDTSGADRFETYYVNSGTWTRTGSVSQWPNTQYNDITSGLVTMSNNRYANLWFYIEPDGELVMLYGQAQFVSSSQAENEQPPSTIPDRVTAHAKFIGRLLFKKSDGTATQIDTIYETVFVPTQASDHNNLSNNGGTGSHAVITTHLADTANPHGTDIENLGGGTLAELNGAVSDATLVDTDDILLNADIAPAEGFVRKTGSGTYTAHKSNLAASTAPTVNEDSDDGYSVGSEWIDTTGDKIYFCLDATVGAAVWQEVGSGGGGGESNTASNVNVAGVGVWKQKTGVDLEFRGVNAASSKITVALDAGNNEIDIDVAEGNLSLANLGTRVVDNLSDVDTVSDSPSLNEVLKWDGSNWVPGTAGDTTEFTFSIDSFSDGISDLLQLIGSGTWKAVGAISFTATYSNAPGGMTAEVAQSGATSAWGGNLSMTPVEGPETNTELVDYPASATGAVTFTLSQSADASEDTESVSFSNTMRYGTNANGIGAQTEANVEALSEVAGPNESRSQTISNISTDAGNELTFAYANRLSNVAQVQMNSGNGFVTASFNATPTTLAPTIQTSGLTTITNSAGFVEAFKAITSRLTDLTDGSNDFKLLTSGTALNHMYWGHVAKSSGITEADAESLSGGSQVASNSMSSRSMTITGATGSDYTVIAYPARLGALTSIIIGGFESLGDFNVDSTSLAMTNEGGYQEDYRVYVSVNPGFSDPTTMTVTI